jgi:hypothetical protein
MPGPPDIAFGALPHDRECSICAHPFHYLRCGDDLGAGVPCPCHCPVPGIY